MPRVHARRTGCANPTDMVFPENRVMKTSVSLTGGKYLLCVSLSMKPARRVSSANRRLVALPTGLESFENCSTI